MSVANNPISISRLGQVAINAHDLSRATAFYRDILGLPLLFTAGNLAFFEKSEIRRSVYDRIVNAAITVAISAAIAMHDRWGIK